MIKRKSMIQVQLPDEISPILSDIKEVRSRNMEPKTVKAIVIDALKTYHENKCSNTTKA